MPGGRPKGLPKTGGRQKGTPNKLTAAKRATLAELAQAHTDTALSALVEVAQSGSDSARVAAAVAILDRGWGRPLQATELSGPDGGPVQIEQVERDADEFASRVLRLASARGLAPGDGGPEPGDKGGA